MLYEESADIAYDSILEDDVSLLAVPESIDRYDDAGIAEESPMPMIRKDFPESWIWESFDGYDHGFFIPVFSLLSLPRNSLLSLCP